MAGESGAVWAIDIGQSSLKALYLSTERGYVEVMGFDNIQHGKMLSSEDVTAAERQELIALSLRKLVTTYDLSGADIAVSVPSQNSFIRFVNLPPVEAKRIPEMVKFEAVQQIPFDINDIQWDWQLMTEPTSPELKVGIFAIKNEVANAALEPLTAEEIEANYVQIAPMALYNFLLYDHPELVASDNQAAVVINIGATSSDIIVCTKSAVWQRCVLIGGNNFTKAIANTFRLNFEKAEKLKRTAAMSKYARQIFQAMKPVFSDLTSELQRSLGFYNSANPNTKVTKIIAMGGGSKLRGLLQYMQQTLQMPVERPDSFKKLAMASSVSQAKFHENVGDFGVVYGLALQALGLARIESNLLPRTVTRSREWAKKGRYFIAAACMLLAVSLMSFARTGLDKMNYGKQADTRDQIQRIITEATNLKTKLTDFQDRAAQYETIIAKNYTIFGDRKIIAQVQQEIISALPNEKNTPDQKDLYQAFAKGDVAGVKKVPRRQRKQIFITGLSVYYSSDLGSAVFGEKVSDFQSRVSSQESTGSTESTEGTTDAAVKTDKGFVVSMVGYSPYGPNVSEFSKLFDPSNVDKQKDKWGFVTRLGNLEITDGDKKIYLQLYKKTERSHYQPEIKDLDLAQDIAPGIGEYKTGSNAVIEEVLIDPMTGETMNKQGTVINDHWFTLNLKFLIKDSNAPAVTAAPAAPAASSAPASNASSTTNANKTTTTSTTRTSSSGRNAVDFE
jgi:type IV pilus assembly protein PilM